MKVEKVKKWGIHRAECVQSTLKITIYRTLCNHLQLKIQNVGVKILTHLNIFEILISSNLKVIKWLFLLNLQIFDKNKLLYIIHI